MDLGEATKSRTIGVDEVFYITEIEAPSEGALFGVTHLLAHARGTRYDLWIVFDTAAERVVITLANFGRAMTLDHYPERLHWDYVADKLSLRPVDAQAVTHMINRAFATPGPVT